MRYLKYIFILVLFAQVFTSCDTVDFGDTNKNSNGPSDPYPAGLMSGAMMSFSTITGRNGITRPTLFVQYQSQVSYVDEMLYSSPPVDWSIYYDNCMKPLDVVINYVSNKENQTPAVLSQGSPENQIGVAMIMKAIVMKRVTDTWGPAPYSEAFKGVDNLTPKYDSQETIYKALIDQVKAGRDMLDAGTTAPTGDIIYDGDVTKWKMLANSFILQATVQLSKVYPSPSGYAATEFNAALNDPAGVIENIGDEAWFKYEDQSGFRNPWNQNRAPDYFLSKEFTDAMHGSGSLNPTSNTTPDARIQVYSTDPVADGVPYGYRNGGGPGAQMSGDYYWNNTSPLPLMTASYTFLNRADAANMGWTAENVATMLTEGIDMSFATLENHTGGAEAIAAAGPAYAAARVADAGTAPGGMTQVIAEEKWKSLFPQGFDAWAEWRRTGYPQLQYATDNTNGDKGILTRYVYPTEESTLNGGNYKSALSNLQPGDDNGNATVWWDK